MTPINVTSFRDVKDLTRGRQIVQLLGSEWDEEMWSELLAGRVALSVKPGKSRLDQFDWYRAIGGNPCVTEREDVLRLLKGISVDLGIRLSATAKLIRGRDIVLLGDFAVLPERTDIEPLSEPVVLYLGLDDDGGKIESMMLAAVELRPLVEAILDVARGGTSHKG